MNPAELGGASPRPPFWTRVSIPVGNLIQISGLVAGSAILYLTARLQAEGLPRVLLMILGWLIIYVCSHSLGHWVVGRLLGIRFRAYGIRGTDHPEELQAVLRAVLTRLPMFTAITEKESMEKAAPWARAMMFAAGETSTIATVILVGFYAWLSHTPGGLVLLIASILMSIDAVITTSRVPRGDYAKARAALRGR